ncbi:PREDICTED: uncharacterized protein LOC106810766 [Priapulus caudatus]|uniref:Uncharacterized protein LOC106810766 n=1 Tax=Priapulus caudatus TaxID=37621 RepID=A0ABM1EC15_PRICU|nr:PREDICTED: uncharacterized protein LOC106810766 [Priapulus caudatus]
MKFLVALCALVYVAVAAPFNDKIEKRLGVPIQAEIDCLDLALNFSSDATDCQVFYLCGNGWPYIRRCPGDTVWSPADERCMGKYVAINDVCRYEAPDLPVEVTLTPEELDSAACYDPRFRCDGTVNCNDGNDEAGCAPACDPAACRLPDCKCSNAEIPGGFLANEIPQMVLIGWDEALRVEDYNHLLQQILKKVTPARRREPRANPNGCPAVATFFTSHQFTDYAAVQSLYSEGNEFAAHSITKKLPAEQWALDSDAELSAEYSGQRVMFNNLAGVPPTAVKGVRSAYLQTKGADYVKLMQEEGFAYDSSYPTDKMDPPYWPYTFDYQSSAGCPIPPCVTESVPGMWEMPLVDWIDTNDTLCANVDSCYFPNDKAEAAQLLMSNFRRHYDSNRAPFTLNLRARWFLNDGYHNLEALQEFLDEIQENNDVYLVTYSQALAWIQNPVKLSNIGRSDVFACNYADRTPLCEHPNLCGYHNITHEPNDEENQGDRFFQTCADCPAAYPWVDNPAGTA